MDMKKALWMTFFVLFLIGKASAQTTAVTATVTDSDGIAWNNMGFLITFQPLPGYSGQYTYQGAPFIPQQYSGNANSSGTMSITIPDSSFISPAGTKWQFVLQPYASAQSTQFTMPVTGASQDFSTLFSNGVKAPRFAATGNTWGYSTVEVSPTPNPGGQFWNVTTGCMETWDGISSFSCAGAGAVITPNKGGTGSSNPAAHGTAVAEGPSTPFNFVLPTNNGQCYMSAASNFATTDPSFQTCPSGGGGGSSAGPQGTIQEAGSVAGSFDLAPIVDPLGAHTNININATEEVKGPNPRVDATRYGVRALLSLNVIPAISGITSTTTATSPTVTVSTSSCTSQTGNVCFVNGDGVVIQNAGNTQSLATPGAPTVTPFNSRWGTNTGDGVAGPTGATSYNYKLFAFDLMRGRTAVSSVGTTTTGASTLGESTYTITGGSKSNDTITFSGATQPAVSAGAFVIVDTPTQAGDNCYLGYWKIATVTATGFTIANVGLDTRNPMPNCPVTSNGGFTAHFFNYNQVTWTAVTGAYNYGVCSDRASPGTYHLLGTALYATDLLHGSNTYGTLEFDDFGATMTDANHVAPWEFSDADCSGASATNDDWQAVILSGAGSTTLTMTTNAPSSNGGGQPIRFDNSPTYLAARTAVGSNIAIMLPITTSGQYVFNSPLNLTGVNEIMSAPQGFTTNAVVYFNVAGLYCNSPTPGSGSTAPASNKSIPTIGTKGLPGIQIGSAGYYQNSCRITAPDNGTAVQSDAFGADMGPSFVDSQFASGSDSTDYLGRAFVCHNSIATSLNCDMTFTGKTQISGGVQSMASHSATPSLICDGCGTIEITNLTGFGRTLAFRGRLNPTKVSIKSMWWQGPSMPMLLFGGQQSGGNNPADVTLGSTAPVVIDTSSWPCASYIPSVGTYNFSFIIYGGCQPVGTATFQFTGNRFVGPGIISYGGDSAGTGNNVSGQNRDIQQFTWGTANDGIFVGPFGGLGTFPSYKSAAAIEADTSYPIFINGTLPTTPTCSVSSGGSVSTGSHKYQLVPAWWNNAEGLASLPSAACITSTGNQTVTVNWTAVPGVPQGYNIYEDGLRIHQASGLAVSCGTPQITPGSINSIVLTADANCGIPGPSNIPSGGPTMLMPGVQGISAPTGIIGQYIDILQSTPPSNPAVVAGRVYVNNSTNLLACLTNSGANCMPPGCPPGGLIDAIQYNGGPGCSFGGVNSPVLNGNYLVNYNVVANAAVAPTITLPGVPINPQTGTTYVEGSANTQSDRGYLITASNSGAQTYTMGNPSAAGFGQNYFGVLHNIGTGAVTETASGFTVNGGSSLLVPPSWVRFLWSDGVNNRAARFPDFSAFPNCATAITFTAATGVFNCGAAGAVSSLTGDNGLFCNVSSTGAVTLVPCTTTLAHKFWGNNTGSTGTASFVSIGSGDLPATIVYNNQANTYTGGGLQDLSAMTWKFPSSAGAVASATNTCTLDTTNRNIHCYINNADAIMASIVSTPTNNDCAKWSVSSSTVQLADAGAPCGSGSGGGGGPIFAPSPQINPMFPQAAFSTPSASVAANISAATGTMISLTNAIHGYRLEWVVSVTTPGTSCTGTTTVVLNAVFTNPSGSGSTTQSLGTITLATNSNGTAGFIASGSVPILAGPGTAVAYSTSSFTAGSGCSPAPSYQVQPILTQEF